MKALFINQAAKLIDIQNELEALQEAIGGYIESITLDYGAVMIVDEEGRLKGKPLNDLASIIAGTSIVGKALIVGCDGEEFSDVPEMYIECILLLSDVLNER